MQQSTVKRQNNLFEAEFMSLDKIIVIVAVLIALGSMVGMTLNERHKNRKANKKPADK